MNLEQTIAELEQKAQQYTEAANTLRALEARGTETSQAAPVSAPAAPVTPPAASKKNASSKGSKAATATKGASSKQAKSGQKRYVSPETRAKITAALKASHAAKKAAAAAAA